MDDDEITGEPTETAADETERLRTQLEEERQRNLRLLADFENSRRRVQRELETAQRDARREAILPLLPVLDALELALATGSGDAEFFEGIVNTHRQFLHALRQAGVEPVKSVGRAFDPHLHEVVETVASEEVEPGHVAREIRRGWRLGDVLLRPAQVAVATARETAQPWR